MTIHAHSYSTLLLAFACSMLTTAVQAKQNDVPFRATLTVQETITNDASCPGLLRGTLTGSGTVTHLGKVTINATQCVAFGGRGSLSISRDVLTFTSANGDLLWAEWMGTISPLPGDLQTNTLVGSFNFTGGTGRFANSEGEGLITGTFSGDLGSRVVSGALSAEGRINY